MFISCNRRNSIKQLCPNIAHTITQWSVEFYYASQVSICAKWLNGLISYRICAFIFRNPARPIPIIFYPLRQPKIFSYTNHDDQVCQNKAKRSFGKYNLSHCTRGGLSGACKQNLPLSECKLCRQQALAAF